MPDVKTVSYSQDNAGCYHSGFIIACANAVGKESGKAIKRLDFSDPQCGKGASDRKAALIKSHMHIYLNSGNDIVKLAQMVEAVLSSGGVASLSVTLCESITSPPMVTCKIDGVSKLSNIELTIEGIRVWRAYGVGTGKLISDPKAEIPSLDSLPSMVVYSLARPSSFSFVVKGRTTTTHLSETHANRGQTETDEEPATANEALLHAQKKDVVRHS